MEKIEITEKYANVLKHRLNKSKLPHFAQLKKLALSGFSTKTELKEYVKRAKASYDSLLNINSTTSKKLMK